MIENDDLIVQFAGEYSARLSPSEDLTFGRTAQLVIDQENQYLHRKLGKLYHNGDRWLLRNSGSHITIEIDSPAGANATVPSGSTAAVPQGRSYLRFRAGRFRYEVECERATDHASSLLSMAADSPSTVAPTTVNLTLGRRVLLAALAEPELTAQPMPRPSSAELAKRLDTTPKAVERKLDAICETLDPHRVLGLAGSQGTAATARRELLVRYVIETGMIKRSDLELLFKLDAGSR